MLGGCARRTPDNVGPVTVQGDVPDSLARILIVEDDQTMANMVAYNLTRRGFEVEHSGDGAEGLRRARDRSISLIVLDLMLPSIDGIHLLRDLRAERPTVPVLMLTARDEEELKLEGFAAGTDDYLTKPFSMEELVARVNALLRRSRADTQDGPAEVALGDLQLHLRDKRCWVDGTEIDLRPKEFALLAAMATEPGRLFTRTDLGEQVWGYPVLGDTRTIDTHVKNVRRKLRAHSAYEYIETVRGLGYRFRVRPARGARA